MAIQPGPQRENRAAHAAGLEQRLLTSRECIDAKIRAGLAELDRGEGIPEDELDAWLDRLKPATMPDNSRKPSAGETSAQ